MKSKKLISLLCAAAMSASAFAGLTVTASAATPVYTFDGSDITGFSGNGTLAQVMTRVNISQLKLMAAVHILQH